QLAHDRSHSPVVGGRRQLRVEHGLGRQNLIGEEGASARRDLAGGVIGCEVHQGALRPAAASPVRASGSTMSPMRSNPSPTVSPARKRKWMPSRITASLYAANARYQRRSGTGMPARSAYASSSSSNAGYPAAESTALGTADERPPRPPMSQYSANMPRSTSGSPSVAISQSSTAETRG